MPSYQPSDVATLLGVSVHTIRRWCDWHGEHLSEGATPPPGVPRRFTDRDVEVMRLVQSLRSQGMQTKAVNDRLATTAIPEIETVDALTTSQEAPDSTLGPSQVISYLESLENRTAQRLANVERRQRDQVVIFAAGVLVASVFFLLIVLLIRLGG